MYCLAIETTPLELDELADDEDDFEVEEPLLDPALEALDEPELLLELDPERLEPLELLLALPELLELDPARLEPFLGAERCRSRLALAVVRSEAVSCVSRSRSAARS